MAAEGAQVLATDLRAESLSAFAGVANVRTATLDVLDKAQIEAVVGRAGKIDVLFNCAGYVHAGTVLDATDADYEFAMNLNVRSQFWAIRAVLPGMLEAGSGSIVNMASVASSVRGLPSRFVYGVSKAAVVGLTKSVAADYVGRGIRCNCICPGTVGHALARRPHQCVCGPGRGAQGLHRPPADGPAGDGRGDRTDRGVPGKRRIRLRHRPRAIPSTAA